MGFLLRRNACHAFSRSSPGSGGGAGHGRRYGRDGLGLCLERLKRGNGFRDPLRPGRPGSPPGGPFGKLSRLSPMGPVFIEKPPAQAVVGLRFEAGRRLAAREGQGLLAVLVAWIYARKGRRWPGI